MFDYRLTQEQFWSLTPYQFWAIGKRFEASIQRQDYRAGLVAAILWNSNKGKDQPTKQPYSWFPSIAPDPRSVHMTGEAMLTHMKNVAENNPNKKVA